MWPRLPVTVVVVVPVPVPVPVLVPAAWPMETVPDTTADEQASAGAGVASLRGHPKVHDNRTRE